eukprot:m.47277 g.47277  ORF g.47277 m.47277 type:complete len:338 (+) comp10755_c0_seq1:3-1016(+)
MKMKMKTTSQSNQKKKEVMLMKRKSNAKTISQPQPEAQPEMMQPKKSPQTYDLIHAFHSGLHGEAQLAHHPDTDRAVVVKFFKTNDESDDDADLFENAQREKAAWVILNSDIEPSPILIDSNKKKAPILIVPFVFPALRLTDITEHHAWLIYFAIAECAKRGMVHLDARLSNVGFGFASSSPSDKPTLRAVLYDFSYSYHALDAGFNSTKVNEGRGRKYGVEATRIAEMWEKMMEDASKFNSKVSPKQNQKRPQHNMEMGEKQASSTKSVRYSFDGTTGIWATVLQSVDRQVQDFTDNNDDCEQQLKEKFESASKAVSETINSEFEGFLKHDGKSPL